MSRYLTTKLLINILSNVFSLKLNRYKSLKPLFFTHYLTLKCNFGCCYCSFANENDLNKTYLNSDLNTTDTIQLMRIIYRECTNIYLTGGEPLLRNDIFEIVKACFDIGFNTISINTNMSLIHRNMQLLDYISNLVASLDIINEQKYSEILGVSKSMVKKIKDNIIECSKLQEKKKFSMVVNCVIIPETVNDVREVMDFCFVNNMRIAIVPAVLEDGGIDPKLKHNDSYRQLVEDIIKEKKRGRPIFGSHSYLNTIYDFKPFDCYPTLTPHTYPDGGLFYPCQPMQKVSTNLLEIGSYSKALKMGFDKFGPLPMCRNKCYKACYIEPSIYTKHPFLLFKENL